MFNSLLQGYYVVTKVTFNYAMIEETYQERLDIM